VAAVEPPSHEDSAAREEPERDPIRVHARVRSKLINSSNDVLSCQLEGTGVVEPMIDYGSNNPRSAAAEP
jgi:hypothetical protein